MSSQKFAVPFRISLKTSFILGGGLLLMYCGAFYWLLNFQLSPWVKMIGVVVILVSFVSQLRHCLFRKGKRAVESLIWKSDSAWDIQTIEGENVPATLLGSTFVHPWLIILNFKPDLGGRMWPVVIMPDSLDSTTFRRLISRLRQSTGTLAEQ